MVGHAADRTRVGADVATDSCHIRPQLLFVFDQGLPATRAEDDVVMVADECLGHGGVALSGLGLYHNAYPGLTAWASLVSRLRRWVPRYFIGVVSHLVEQVAII